MTPDWLVRVLTVGIPVLVSVIYVITGTGTSLASAVTDPYAAGMVFAAVGIAIAVAWLWAVSRGPVVRLMPLAVGLGYFGLLVLGLGALLLVEHFAALRYPIAQYEILPTIPMITKLLLWDVIAGLCLIAGIWLGWTLRPPTVDIQTFAAGREHPHLSPLDGDRLAWVGKRLFAIGVGGSAIVVASSHGLAILENNIDTVRYSQDAGIGFAALAQFELISSAVIGLVLAFASTQRRRLGAALFIASVCLLIATRAERTPALVAVFSSLILLRQLGWRPRFAMVLGIAVLILAGVLYLGIFRLQSQAGTLSPQEREVRALLDVSPEVREQAFVYTLFPSEIPYTPTSGPLSIALSVVPGKLLAPLGLHKGELVVDSSHQYAADMNALHIYDTPVPVRVGLVGELWMDGGPLALILGMLAFGGLASLVSAWRPATLFTFFAKAILSAFLVVALIVPLAVVAPLLLVTVGPLLVLGRSVKRSSTLEWAHASGEFEGLRSSTPMHT